MSDSEKKTPIIHCENLVKIYKTSDIEVVALQGLELSIDKGELMAIIGNSGSGKSTFLNMIGGLDRPSAGKLFVDSMDLFKLSEEELVNYKRSTVGFVWQNNARNLLPYLTAIQNVQLPMFFGGDAEKKKRALELLELIGMSHRKEHRLNQLSGGEQQRIAIAIALANKPKILLADEPTGSVDAKTTDMILDIFKTLNEEFGLTIVMVTHDRSLSKRVKRVVAIRDGKTSSEFRVRQSYEGSLDDISSFEDENIHEEFAVLDRAGRVQIPTDMLSSIGIKGNKVKIEVVDGSIIIQNPSQPDTDNSET